MTINQLRKEARELIAENIDNLAMRSCWNCNQAHEHLKNVNYVIVCAWGCGHYFYKGEGITVSEQSKEGDSNG